jgi:hypothetical protein
MNSPPQFLVDRETIEKDESFQPQQGSRKGELIAWGSAILIAVALGIYYLLTQSVQCMTAGLFLFFLASGAVITFGIWTDARTRVDLSRAGLHYNSPFRDVILDWADLQSLRASKAGAVWKVTVSGADQYFTLRISEEPLTEDNPRGFLVLPEGDRLVRLICGTARLSNPKLQDADWVCENPRSAKG